MSSLSINSNTNAPDAIQITHSLIKRRLHPEKPKDDDRQVETLTDTNEIDGVTFYQNPPHRTTAAATEQVFKKARKNNATEQLNEESFIHKSLEPLYTMLDALVDLPKNLSNLVPDLFTGSLLEKEIPSILNDQLDSIFNKLDPAKSKKDVALNEQVGDVCTALDHIVTKNNGVPTEQNNTEHKKRIEEQEKEIEKLKRIIEIQNAAAENLFKKIGPPVLATPESPIVSSPKPADPKTPSVPIVTSPVPSAQKPTTQPRPLTRFAAQKGSAITPSPGSAASKTPTGSKTPQMYRMKDF